MRGFVRGFVRPPLRARPLSAQVLPAAGLSQEPDSRSQGAALTSSEARAGGAGGAGDRIGHRRPLKSFGTDCQPLGRAAGGRAA